MCCTVGPSEMSNTTIYAARVGVKPKDWKWVLGYQNKASSKGGDNAMILPIPSKHPLKEEHFLPVEDKYRDWLRDYKDSLSDNLRTLGGMDGIDDVLLNGVSTFRVSGYTVTSCDSPDFLREGLEKAGLYISDHLLNTYKDRYDGWPILICRWEGDIEANPLLVTYDAVEQFRDRFFIPALDSHDGYSFPREVPRDHTILTAIETERMVTLDQLPKHGIKFPHRLNPEFPHLKWFPWFHESVTLKRPTKNGDFSVSFEETRSGFYLSKGFEVYLPTSN